MATETSNISRNNVEMNDNHRCDSLEETDNNSGMSSTTESSRLSVNFDFDSPGKDADRKKFFTGKYDDRERKKIKHRIKVENWLWEQLLVLHGCDDDTEHDCEIDIDDLNDFETDDERRTCLKEKLRDAKESNEKIEEFIENLLRYARPFWDAK